MDNNPFWSFTLHVYDIKQVRDILLRWQDNYACDVNMLLCSCWLASLGRQLSAEQIFELQQVTRLWREQCVLPLRNIRRFVKLQPAADSIYQQLKHAEVSAEQWQQQLMFDCLQSFSWEGLKGGEGSAVRNLQCYFDLLNVVTWKEVAVDAEELLSLLKL